MKKIFVIGWKDVLLSFRDRAALLFMLLAPFLLTLGLGLVTGQLSGGSSGFSSIPVALVNQDEGQLGEELVKLFQSDELSDIVTPTVYEDEAEARQLADDDQIAAVVIIPAGYSNSIIPQDMSGNASGELVQIEIYANPGRPTSAGVIQTIVRTFSERVETARIGAVVSITQLIENGLIGYQDIAAVAQEAGDMQVETTSRITVNSSTDAEEKTVTFDPLAYMAPGMALMFLMFTVSNGGRALLAEKHQGTLPRLLVSPTRSYQVLGGKVLGIFLTGLAQMLILVIGSALLFRLNWGDPLAVLALVVSAVAGAVGWGMLITALAKTPGQVTTAGSAIMLLFGILGGSFFSLSNFPEWFRLISKITPNAWGLDAFTTLASGGGFGDILVPLAALWIMGLVLFGIAVAVFNRRGLAGS